MNRSCRLVVVATLACALAVPARATDPPPAAAPTPDPHAHGHHHPPPGERHARQLAARAELRRSLDAMDARIDRLADALDAAEGEGKLAARETLLVELMAQRQRLREMLLGGEVVEAADALSRAASAAPPPSAGPGSCCCAPATGGAHHGGVADGDGHPAAQHGPHTGGDAGAGCCMGAGHHEASAMEHCATAGSAGPAAHCCAGHPAPAPPSSSPAPAGH
jgi:hypothetical protein